MENKYKRSTKNHPEEFDRPGKLVETVTKLLRDSNKTMFEIYRESGIPYYWLQGLLKGRALNPSANRVEFLYKHLTGEDIIPPNTK